MSEGTKTAILLVLLVFAISAIVWPLAMGIYLEQQAQKKERNDCPALMSGRSWPDCGPAPMRCTRCWDFLQSGRSWT